MKYCVIKDTIKVIDGSDNPLEIMLQNALNAGFSESGVETLSEAEYQARLGAEPKPLPQPTDKERIEALESALLEVVLNG